MEMTRPKVLVDPLIAITPNQTSGSYTPTKANLHHIIRKLIMSFVFAASILTSVLSCWVGLFQSQVTSYSYSTSSHIMLYHKLYSVISPSNCVICSYGSLERPENG